MKFYVSALIVVIIKVILKKNVIEFQSITREHYISHNTHIIIFVVIIYTYIKYHHYIFLQSDASEKSDYSL